MIQLVTHPEMVNQAPTRDLKIQYILYCMYTVEALGQKAKASLIFAGVITVVYLLYLLWMLTNNQSQE